jgi:hypothetical protein
MMSKFVRICVLLAVGSVSIPSMDANAQSGNAAATKAFADGFDLLKNGDAATAEAKF